MPFLKRPGFDNQFTLQAPSAAVEYAENEVFRSFGDKVSVFEKGKSLLKFGRHTDLDTADGFATVWNHGADQPNEVYVFTNIIDTLSSTSASDTEELVIEGHTASGSGSDIQYTFVVQNATLNGQNKVTLTTPLARVSRIANLGGTDLIGDIYIYEDGTISGGAPTDLSTVHGRINAGVNQTFKAATTFSNVDYCFIFDIYASVLRSNTAIVDYQFEVREPGGVFRPRYSWSSSQSSGLSNITFTTPIIIKKNSDCRILAATTANNTTVNAGFNGYLAKVIT